MKQMQTSALPVLLAAMLFAGATAGKLLAQDTGSGAESASVAGEIERSGTRRKRFTTSRQRTQPAIPPRSRAAWRTRPMAEWVTTTSTRS